jgi:predicted dienelactone hydrolase
MTHGRRVAAVVTVLLASALAVAPSSAHAARDQGSGSKRAPRVAANAGTTYAVGTRSLEFVDRSRPTDPNRDYPGAPARTLPVVVLYPATGTPGANTVADAKPARKAGPFPLVVFSHGFTANGPAYQEWLLKGIAEQGYVVAAPTFPLSRGQAPGGPRLLDYVNQPGDVSFVIDRMLAVNRGHGFLGGLMAPKRIGAAGHSLGAITTLGVTYNRCCLDRRIKAAVPISGVRLPFGSSSWVWPPVPLLLIHGDQDRTVPVRGSQVAYDEAKAPKFLVTLLGAPHVPIQPPYLDIIVKTTTDFFDRYLVGEKAALARLERDGTVPGAATIDSDPK